MRYTLYNKIEKTVIARHKPWPTSDGSTPIGMDPDLVLLEESEERAPKYDESTQELITSWVYDVQAGTAVLTKALRDRTPEEIEILRVATIQRKIETLWKNVSTWAEKAYDIDFRIKCLSWKYDPASSATRLSRIEDLETWADTIWVEYYRIKTMYQENDFSESFDSSVIAPRPWSFIEVASV